MTVPDTPPAATEPVLGTLFEVWDSLAEACALLEPAQWALPTDCPGWNVRDQVSHIVGVERMLLGDPGPPAPAAMGDHVRNPIGQANEAWIEARRSAPGHEVLAELVEVADRRRAILVATPAENFAVVGHTLLGTMSLRDFLGRRVFDTWVHEQDIRRAVARPGDTGGPGEAMVVDAVAGSMGRVVGKQVAPPEGSSVVWELVEHDLDGPVIRVVALSMVEGRAAAVDAPASPTVGLRMATATFWRLGCGRVTAAHALAEGLVRVTGARPLAEAVLGAANFMF